METFIERSTKYGFANARVKALKSFLLTRREIEEMLLLDMQGVIGILERGAYKAELHKFSLSFKGEELIEKAVEENFRNVIAKLLKLSTFPEMQLLCKKFMHELLYEKFTYSEKNILKRRKLKTAKKNEESLAEHIEEDKRIARELVKLKDDELRKILIEEIKLRELIIIIRAKRKEISILNQKFQFFSDSDVQKPEDELVKRFKMKYLTEAWEESLEKNSVVPLEIAAERHIAKLATKRLHMRVLSLSAIAGYLYLKAEEIRNIRKITRGKQFNIPQEQLKAMLVVS